MLQRVALALNVALVSSFAVAQIYDVRSLYLTSPRLYGPDVVALQQRLFDLGYESVGDIDGYFGPLTQGAVREFQAANGLTPDGVADLETLYYLIQDDAMGPTATPTPSESLNSEDARDRTTEAASEPMAPDATPATVRFESRDADDAWRSMETPEDALFNLLRSGRLTVEDLLADLPINVDAPDASGFTLLMVALKQGYGIDVVSALLGWGADPDAVGPDGWTPAMFAARYGSTHEVVALIVGASNTLDTTDVHGRTAADIARIAGNESYARTIEAITGSLRDADVLSVDPVYDENLTKSLNLARDLSEYLAFLNSGASYPWTVDTPCGELPERPWECMVVTRSAMSAGDLTSITVYFHDFLVAFAAVGLREALTLAETNRGLTCTRRFSNPNKIQVDWTTVRGDLVVFSRPNRRFGTLEVERMARPGDQVEWLGPLCEQAERE